MRSTDAIRGALSSLRKLDADAACTMPTNFYTDEDFLELEKYALFRQQWVCLGHVGEIPENGDFFTTEVVDEQLIVLRNSDGDVEVLSNVCRHRGNMVAEGQGNRSRFVCSYHGWTYKNDGQLIGAPFMEKVAGFDKKACRLPAFNVEIWNNFIFVNLDGNAEPLAPKLSGLQSLMKNYHHEMRHLVFSEEMVWDTNWKNMVENFIEGYHLSATHPQTLHPISPTELCEKFAGDEAYTGFFARYAPNLPARGYAHEDLSEDEKRKSVMALVYPGLMLGVVSNFTIFVCARPKGVDQVSLRWGVAGFTDDPKDQSVIDYVKLCHEFFEEDHEKLIMLQLAQLSKYYEQGRLAPADFEGTIWDFLNYIANRFHAVQSEKKDKV